MPCSAAATAIGLQPTSRCREFHLGDAVPEDHLVRKIDTALDLSWLRRKLTPHYSSTGRPSIDPELMIRMLVVGYVFAIGAADLP
jgi:transposase